MKGRRSGRVWSIQSSTEVTSEEVRMVIKELSTNLRSLYFTISHPSNGNLRFCITTDLRNPLPLTRFYRTSIKIIKESFPHKKIHSGVDEDVWNFSSSVDKNLRNRLSSYKTFSTLLKVMNS